ncbi:MAG: hypothetical protein WCO77_06485 [bacterium]
MNAKDADKKIWKTIFRRTKPSPYPRFPRSSAVYLFLDLMAWHFIRLNSLFLLAYSFDPARQLRYFFLLG